MPAGTTGYCTHTGHYPYFVGAEPLLPIELVFFDVKKHKVNSAQLSWITASETNNDYFTIEKSKDGISFTPIAVIKSKSNGLTHTNYNYIDESIGKGISYYVLKQTNTDGTLNYSKVISLESDMINYSLDVSPNPSSVNSNPKLSFTGSNNGKVFILIKDITGKTISEKESGLDSDGNVFMELNYSFSKGIYFIDAQDIQTGAKVHQKFIVN